MTVDALEYNFLAIDKHAIFGIAIISMTIFDGAETKFLTFHMKQTATTITQREYCCIAIRLFGIPQAGMADHEIYQGTVATNSKSVTMGNGFTTLINNFHTYCRTGNSTIQIDFCSHTTISFRIYGYSLDVESWFRHDEDRAPDTTEIPIIGTTFSKIHLWISTLL